jgi:uncharacterized membrane protein
MGKFPGLFLLAAPFYLFITNYQLRIKVRTVSYQGIKDKLYLSVKCTVL